MADDKKFSRAELEALVDQLKSQLATERKKRREANKEAGSFRKFVENSPQGAYITSVDGELAWHNVAFAEALGYSKDDLLSKNVSDFYANPEDRERFLKEIMEKGIVRDFELDMKAKDGSIVHALIYARAVRKGTQITGFKGHMINITKRKNLEEELNEEKEKSKKEARTDELTGLPNRRSLLEQEERYHDEAQDFYDRAVEYNLSMIIFDVDGFKAYNDTYGHDQADNALKTIAGLLKNYSPCKKSIAGRYGGEEFELILPDTSHDRALAIAEELRQKIADMVIPKVAEDVEMPDGYEHVTVSIGVGTYDPERRWETFFRAVDKAMYKAKEGGKNRVESIENLES